MIVENYQRVDKHQLKVLVMNNLKLDWRGATNPFTSYNNTKRKFPGMLAILGMNVFLSIFVGLVFIRVADLFSGLVISASIAMLAISMQIMLEFGNTLISPDDYNIISPHPVSSRTFFIAKIINTVIYVSILTASIAFIPSILAAFRLSTPLVIPVVWLHFWICNVFAAVFMMNFYTWILQKIDRQRLERWLGYIHMGIMLSTYLAMNVMPRWLNSEKTLIDISQYLWAKFIPAYWFGSIIKLVIDGWNLELLALGLLGIILAILLGRIAVSYLSLSYAESLTKTSWKKDTGRKKESTGYLAGFWKNMANPEDKALMKLIRSNFKHDVQFRLGVMAMVPLIVFYLVISLVAEGTNVRDPFTIQSDSQVMTNLMLGLVCIIAPYTLIGALQASKQWKAAWVFFATPMNRTNMILAMERIANMLITIPLAIFLAVVQAFLFGSILHAVLHTTAMISIALCALTLINIFSIRLPFAMDNTGSNWAGSVVKPMLIGMAGFGVPLAVIGIVGYGGYAGWAGFTAFFIIVRWLLVRGQKKRIEKELVKWEFSG